MFAYCENNPTNKCDPTGEFGLGTIGLVLGKAALGAAVNVMTTYIGAKVTGQSYSIKDAAIAAASGALGTGNTMGKILAGAVSGVYSGATAYSNGANVGKALVAGLTSGIGTTVSVANIAGWGGVNLSVGTSTFVDVVFGTGANSIAAAVYRASTDTSPQNVTTNQARSITPQKQSVAMQRLMY